MKLHMEELYTHIFTLADKPVLDDIRTQFKEQRNLDWEAEHIAHLVSTGAEVLKYTHTLSKNNKVKNRYTDDSGNIDIRLDIMAYDKWEDRFYKIIGHVSDAWDINGDNSDEIRDRLYVTPYDRNR